MASLFGIGETVTGVAQGLSAHIATNRSRKEASDARRWSEKMRRTAYQTAVEDLRKAGLNPLLATGAQPGYTPSGPMGQVFKPDFDFRGIEGRILSGAKQMGAFKDELRTIKANADTAENTAKYAGPTADANIDLIDAQAARNFEEAQLANLQANESVARKANIDVMRRLAETDLPAAQARMRLDESEFGQRVQQFQRVLQALPVFGGSVGRPHRGGTAGTIRSR